MADRNRGDILWTPPPERVAGSLLVRFVTWAIPRAPALRAIRPADDFPDYASLHRWSVTAPEEFWGLFARFADIRFVARPTAVLADGDRLPGARWFPGATLDLAWHLLRHAEDAPGAPALIWRDERGRRGELSWQQLVAEATRVAAGLRAFGVGPGDCVAGILPNGPEAVIAFLATVLCRATWASCSPDFGAAGVLDRLAPLKPRVLFVTDGYCYGGKRHELGTVLATIREGLPDARMVMVPFLDPPGGDALPEAVPFAACGTAEPGAQLPAAVVDVDHPLCVLFSSGTTGPPKGIVHGAGRVLIQHLKEHLLHGDLRRGDRLFYFTTCGWMMWNWLVSGLAAGATLVLYDGSPMEPDAGVLWRLAAEEGVTHFGASPRYLGGLRMTGYRPRDHHDLSRLRTVFSTGAPLGPEGFAYVYDAVSGDVQLASISGGTDLVSCFALGNPLVPVRAGELQGPGLGMAVDVYDDAGLPLPAGTGELVCTRPFPTVPLGFRDDPGGERFRRAYFARFPGVWAHGDFAEWTASGGLVIHGRSDATLNPGGVRIGTGELYRALTSVPEVVEAVAVDQCWQGDTRIVMGVVLRAGVTLDDALAARIRSTIRQSLTPRHVPAVLFAIPDIPRTRSGKVSELAVRAVIHGEALGNTAALANPEALDHFRDRPELLA